MSENIHILLKLFDTLKEASDRNGSATEQLIVQQLELVSHIKHLPIEDLKQALKDHAKEASEDITSCSDTVESTSSGIKDEIQKINGKVGKAILVVVVAFTVMTGMYAFVKYDTSKSEKQTVEILEELKREIQEIKR